MSVALQRHRGISRAMIRAAACTHDLLQSAVPPWAVVLSRQEALDGGIRSPVQEECGVSGVADCSKTFLLVVYKIPISWLYKVWQDLSSIVEGRCEGRFLVKKGKILGYTFPPGEAAKAL
jgi:hypothetical protein